MPITLRSHISDGAGAGDHTQVSITGQSVSQNDLIVAGISDFADAPAGSFSDSIWGSSPYTGLTAKSVAGNTRARIWWGYATGSSDTVTFNYNTGGTNSYPTMFLSIWIGAKSANAFDQENGATEATGTATTLSTGSVTPTEGSELLIALLCVGDLQDAQGIDGGFTMLDVEAHDGANQFGGGLAYLIQDAAAAANPQFNWINPAEASAAIATFKAAVAAAELQVLLGEPTVGGSVF